MSTLVNWFEIPAVNLDRAQAFYQTVLGCSLRREPMGDMALAVFPYIEPATGGCLMSGAGVAAPSQSGALVYLDAGPSLDATVARVAAAGGQVLVPRVDLPDGMGCFAHVLDTEGNRVGLHAQH